MKNEDIKSPILKNYINNDFLIIPLNKILGVNMNYNTYSTEDTWRLHLDILKNEEEKQYV